MHDNALIFILSIPCFEVTTEITNDGIKITIFSHRILKKQSNMLLQIVLQYLAYFTGIQSFILTPDSQQIDTTANTNCGPVRGIWSQNIGSFSFLGLPYASPPVGSLRWRPPVQMRKENNNCWQGIFLADKFGDQCVQRDYVNASKTVGKEDCLFLNIFTPTLNVSAELPVMFWIHGGGLTNGNGSQTGYAPTEKLAKSLNVVFVSVQYRLQALGFLSLEWLKDGSKTNTSGNYGLMDLIEGLRWVQENIHNFGGNPSEVETFY